MVTLSTSFYISSPLWHTEHELTCALAIKSSLELCIYSYSLDGSEPGSQSIRDPRWLPEDGPAKQDGTYLSLLKHAFTAS